MNERFCMSCGASYGLSFTDERVSTCLISTDGGGTCNGEIREVVINLKQPTMDEFKSITERAAKDASMRWADVRPLLSRVEMRHGRVIPDGIAFAMISFASVEDRTAFADLLTVAGGKVGGI